MAETPTTAPAGARRRLIIHAGFGKCGSSSIQRALFQNVGRMREEGIHFFDKNLRIAKEDPPRVSAHRFLTEAKKKRANLAEQVTQEVEGFGGRDGEFVGVFSAETLANRGMAQLFVGLDRQFDLSIVFYARPQWQWIPSAWQQWFLKEGTRLDEFVRQCLNIHRPSFRARVEEWQGVLPAATLRLRFLIPEMLTGGDPVRDFFHLLGASADGYDFEGEARNTSLDYAVLHVLSKNPQLFSGIHDNQLRRGLRSALSKKFQSANIRMLSIEQEAKIEECFREENLWLLRNYGGEIDVDQIYQRYFVPPKTGVRYSDISELDLIYRCLGIILEAIALRRSRSSRKTGDATSAAPGESDGAAAEPEE